MKTKKTKLNKSITYLGITFPFLFLSPLLLNLGFKALGRSQFTLGYVFVGLGIVVGVFAIVFMAVGIKYLLDHLFEK